MTDGDVVRDVISTLTALHGGDLETVGRIVGDHREPWLLAGGLADAAGQLLVDLEEAGGRPAVDVLAWWGLTNEIGIHR